MPRNDETTSSHAAGPASVDPGRGLAGRVVVVGDRSLALRIERLLPPRQRPGAVVRVDGFLAALGEASHRSVSAVIGPAGLMVGMAESTSRALRELVPHARLVVFEHPGHEAEVQAMLDSGFDLSLPREVADPQLAEALALPPLDHARPEPAIVHADRHDLSRLGLSPALPPSAMPPSPHASTPSSEEDHEHAAIDAALPADLAGPPCVPIAAADDTLGDTDLVEHILQGQAGLRDLALRLVGAQCRIPSVGLVDPREPVPDQHLSAAVRYASTDFGHLHAPAHVFADPNSPATVAQLQVWADWLARWLALESRFVRLRDLSMRDELTGAWNRRYFNRFLKRIVDRAAEDRQQVTLMIFDIDDFKHYNDAYGHPAGDEILREVAKLMMTSVREHDVVARIGGDEFAVIFWDAEQPRRPHSRHPDDVLNAAKRFQRAVVEHRFPKLLDKAAGNLTISGGLAGFPWDGRTPEELLEFADAMALRSKHQGKNAITVGPGAAAASDDPAAPDDDPATP